MQNLKLQFKIQKFIHKIVLDLYPDCELKVDDIKLEHPREELHGDYATSIAMVLSKKLRSSHQKRADCTFQDNSNNLSGLQSKPERSSRKLNPVEIATKIKEVVDERIKLFKANGLDQNSVQRHQIKSSSKFKFESSKLKNNSFSASGSIEKVIVEKPGFINLFLSHKFLIRQMQSVLEGKKLDGLHQKTLLMTGLPLKNKKVMVEYTDPNPFKEFHIGHLYSNIIGETLCRMLEACGATVARADYFGDVGMHVAKSLFGFLQTQNSKLKIQSHADEIEHLRSSRDIVKLKTILDDLEKNTLKDRVRLLGQAYAEGSTAYKEDKKAQEEIKRINFLIYIAAQRRLEKDEGYKPQVNYSGLVKDVNEDELEAIQLLFETGRRWSLEYFEDQYRRLDTGYLLQRDENAKAFDFYYPESQVGEHGYKLVKEYLKKGIFEENDGAIVFRGDKYGLHTRVFINSLGLPTYEAKELGLAPTKYKDFPYDMSIIVTGNEIKEYFKVLITVLKQIKPELAEKTTHIPHGMVRLPDGKMSSRTGKIITAKWLMDKARTVALHIMINVGTGKSVTDGDIKKILEKDAKGIINRGKKPDVSINEVESIADQVGLAAIKYALLKNNIGSDTAFDFKESLSFEGNSGPYLQYTFARAKSVLRKAKNGQGHSGKVEASTASRIRMGYWTSQYDDLDYACNSEELAVLRTLYKFPEVVAEAVKKYNPHYVCTFLYDLAGKFNTFYNKHSILLEQNKLKAQNSKGKTTTQMSKVSNTKETREFRLALTAAAAQVLKNGLYLLGISAPRKM